MLIADLIERLNTIQRLHGNLEVRCYGQGPGTVHIHDKKMRYKCSLHRARGIVEIVVAVPDHPDSFVSLRMDDWDKNPFAHNQIKDSREADRNNDGRVNERK